jgi:hypothetical protein
MKFINHVELKAGIKDSADSLGTAGQVLSSTGSATQWITSSSSGFVPYTGATGNVDLGIYNLSTNAITLNPTPATIPTAQGSMYFDEGEETLAVILNGTTQRVGEDVFFQIKNQTGVTIPKGTAVRFDGVVGTSGRLLAVPFLANGTYTSQYFLGVTSEAILDGADGKAYVNGKVKKLNTNAYTVGTILYCSRTVAGGFQTTPPIAPNNIISAAVVIAQSATVGKLLIRPQLGSNINNDEGVKIVGGATGDLLQLQSNGLWENKTVSSIFTIPAATSTVLGGIELASDTVQTVASNAVSSIALRTYGLQVNASGQGVVNVPWIGDHTLLANIGTNTHAQIDTALTRLANTSGTNTGDNAVNTLYSGLVSNATHTGEVTGATALTIASGVVDLDNLAVELKATTNLGNVSGTVNINCALGVHFKMVMTGAITSLTFSNYSTQQNKTITLEITGNFTIAQPATVKGDWTGFVGTKTNQIQIYLFNVTTPVFSSALINW